MSDMSKEKEESYCCILQMLRKLWTPGTFHPDPRLNDYVSAHRSMLPSAATHQSNRVGGISPPLISEAIPKTVLRPDKKMGKSSRAKAKTEMEITERKPVTLTGVHQKIMAEGKETLEPPKKRKKPYPSAMTRTLF